MPKLPKALALPGSLTLFGFGTHALVSLQKRADLSPSASRRKGRRGPSKLMLLAYQQPACTTPDTATQLPWASRMLLTSLSYEAVCKKVLAVAGRSSVALPSSLSDGASWQKYNILSIAYKYVNRPTRLVPTRRPKYLYSGRPLPPFLRRCLSLAIYS